MLAHRVGVVADQVGGLLDLADRFEPALAVLPGQRSTVDDRPFGDQVGGAVEERRSAAAHGVAAQPRLGGPCRSDGVVDVVAVGAA